MANDPAGRLPDTVLAAWQHEVAAAELSPVLPDGCRDLICRIDAGQRPHWFISPLATATEHVTSPPGSRYLGFRLHPGTRIDAAGLLAAVTSKAPDAQNEIGNLLADFTRRDPTTQEILATLAEVATPAAARQRLGIRERTLERLCRRDTGQTAGFWIALARVRRAAVAIDSELPLADIAGLCGYADQAHLNRAFRRWFAASPAQFRRSPQLLSLARASGFATDPI